jgi:hypothetical protein
MKRCGTCNRTYTEENLSFCIDDGTPLTEVAEDESTVVGARNSEQGYDQGRRDDWNAVAYKPPGGYVPPGGSAERRRVWPWVLGIVSVLVLGLIGLSIAAILLVPRMIQRRGPAPLGSNDNASSDENQNTDSTKAADSETNTNTNADSETNANTNAGSERPSKEAATAPTDKEQVLAQLTDLENEWTAANLNADKKKLDRILADDYVGQSAEGGTEGKAEYLRTIKRDTTIQKWDFDGLKVSLHGDRATLIGNVKLQAAEQSVTYRFTDRFVWREGRWQATGSEVERVE